ncbi:hypothetical protein B0T20DRAFT_498216 [Sordaria brevicollis]|uniref:Uncharacterized protein n=1 Tax=Sordaria brevicollis TaxID=83679 RepID=A0AAE0PEA9_SORBR|nr:hypothetical protein B0T20DRAFT_498216 [Sordaria brevicollis]
MKYISRALTLSRVGQTCLPIMEEITQIKVTILQRRKHALNLITALKESLRQHMKRPLPDYALHRQPGYNEVHGCLAFVSSQGLEMTTRAENHLWIKVYGYPSVFEELFLCGLDKYENLVNELIQRDAWHLHYRLAVIKATQDAQGDLDGETEGNEWQEEMDIAEETYEGVKEMSQEEEALEVEETLEKVAALRITEEPEKQEPLRTQSTRESRSTRGPRSTKETRSA